MELINAVGGKDSVNAKIHGLKKVFHSGLLESITNSWSAPSIKEGRLKVCAEKCGAEYDRQSLFIQSFCVLSFIAVH